MSATLTVPKEASDKKKEVASAMKSEVASSELALEERIRMRAYELYEKRAGAPGDPDADWYQAEAEIVGGSEQTDH